MVRKRRVLPSILVLLAGGLVFLYRYPILNTVQQQILRGIGDRAIVDNRRLLRDLSYSHHRLYQLRGIQRIWPHRVNSLQRLKYLYDEFAGFECDIRFMANTGTLGIGHDKPEGNLFDDYLRLDSERKKLFWLDIKNVDRDNLDAFCKTLETLENRSGIRDRVILECYDTLAARRLAGLGYLTAVNILTKGLREMPQGAVTLITGETKLHDSIAGAFPHSQQLNWDIPFRHGMSRDNLLRQANDTSLLICLINVKSPGYR
ncbi:MAG TPA: hypothetical protein VNW04_00955 [Puia sp.]|jgi:hypothetical protein|nr:hypothetical protein [Puia sp.]